jgi:hypothetical protein
VSVGGEQDTVKQMRDRIKFEEDVASKDDKDANHVKLHQANWVDESFLNKWFADSWLGNPDHRLPWGMIACAGDLARSPRLVLENINSTAMAFKFQVRGACPEHRWRENSFLYRARSGSPLLNADGEPSGGLAYDSIGVSHGPVFNPFELQTANSGEEHEADGGFSQPPAIELAILRKAILA